MSRAELMRTVGASGHRMPRHLLPALALSLLLLCCACELGYTADGAPVKSVVLFAAGTTKVPEKVGSEDLKRDVGSFASPFLVGGSGVMVALAEAQYTRSGERDVDIVARYVDTEGANWADNTTENIESNWVIQKISDGYDLGGSVLRNPTAVIKGDKIYLLALNNTKPDGSLISGRWHVNLFGGEITGGEKGRRIRAVRLDSQVVKLARKVRKQHLSVFPGSGHSAFLRSNGAIVFSVNATNREDVSGFAVFQWKDDEKHWKVSFVQKPKECRLFSLFEWREKLITIFSGCLTDTSYAKEYDEVKEEWKNVDDALFYSLSRGRARDFISVTIGNKKVLLFIKERPIQRNFGGGAEILLFFTDSNRVYSRVERINTQSAKAASGRLLYTNGELFLIYQDVSKPSGNIVFQRLNWQLEEIEFKLNAWDETDAYLSKSCNETAPEDVSPDTFCVTPMPTAGLVSFLSNSSGHDDWRDEYHFRNARVQGGTRVKNGYTFSEVGEGAQWKIDDGGAMGKRYDFARYGLTVVTTMTIHETPANDTPLLTVGGVLVRKRSGLWYKDNQWKVVSKIGGTESPIDLVTNTTYRVALIVHNNTISAYVNGKFLGSPLPILQPGSKPFDGESIYFGRYWDGGKIHMTVTNVLIYNRVLNDTELENASQKILPTRPTSSEKTPEMSTDTKETPDTLATPKETPETSTDTRETPETSTDTKETPETSTDTKETPDTLATPNETPETSTDTKETPETSTDSKETPETPTDPKEDSSEHVCVGASLLFLLGLRVFASFFLASI